MFETRPSGWRTALAGYVCVAAFASSLAAAEAGLKRWAIIASPAATDSGLSDLLFVAMTKVQDVELVERTDLDRIADELAVAPLGGAEGGAQRLKVGQLLRADALIVLAPPPVVICECRQGARLTAFELADQGKNFGVFTCRAPEQNAGEWIVLASYDTPVVRAVAVYKRNPAGGYLLARDTNNDGLIDDQDEPGTPVLDTEGKPVTNTLSGRFLVVNPDGTMYHSGHQLALIWRFKGLDAHGVPKYEFAKDMVLAPQDPVVPSPYFADKTDDLRCASTAKYVSQDGGICAGINLRHTLQGMGKAAARMRRQRPDECRFASTASPASSSTASRRPPSHSQAPGPPPLARTRPRTMYRGRPPRPRPP